MLHDLISHQKHSRPVLSLVLQQPNVLIPEELQADHLLQAPAERLVRSRVRMFQKSLESVVVRGVHIPSLVVLPFTLALLNGLTLDL